MTATHGEGAYGDSVGVTTPNDHRLANGDLLVKDSTGVPRPGLFWDGNPTIITGKANMSYDVSAFHIATVRSRAEGALLWNNPAVVNVVTTAAPGSNSRIDIIYAWHREFQIDGTDSEPVIAVAQGTPSASPVAPSLSSFPGAVELGRAVVTSGITGTTSATITQTAKFTAGAGGVLMFRNSTERDADTYVAGQPGWMLDTSSPIIYTGARWGSAFPAVTVRKSANYSLATSAVALPWDVEISDVFGMHDNVTNNTRIIAPVAGLYEVTCSLYNGNLSGMGTAYARLNGTTDITGSLDRRTADATAGLPLKVVFSVALSASDYIEIMVLHATAAGTISGGTSTGAAVLTMKRIG